MISKVLFFAACAITLSLADDEEVAEKGVQDCKGSADCTSKVKGVAGHVAMDVKRNGRRLQEMTGFSTDDGAKKAVASALESRCGDSCKSKVHTYVSERQPEAASERRLLSTKAIADVNYTVDCDNSTDCMRIWSALNSVQPPDLTAAIVAELQEENLTEYTVQVENHLVDMVPCALFGVAYNDPFRNEYLNGAVVATALECQKKCADTLFCDYFSWYKDSGGCWLQGNYSKLEVAGSKAAQYAVSGPAVCKDFPAWVSGEQPEVEMKQEGEDLEGTLASGPSSGDSGFPWWCWLIGGVAGAGLVGGGAYMAMGKDGKKRSVKKPKKEIAKNDEEAVPLTSEPTPAVEMPQMPAAPNMTAYSGAPLYPQQQHYYPSVVQQMPMAQPQFTAMATPQYYPTGYYAPQ